MVFLHAVLSVGSMWVILDALLSSVIVSSHVLRDLPRGFLPATEEFKILWSQWVSPLLTTCPYHLSLLFLITCPILTRPIDWRRSSFFFLSHSDVLHTILISAFLIRSMLWKLLKCIAFLYPFHIKPIMRSQRRFENNAVWCECSEAALFDTGVRKGAFYVGGLLLPREVFWKRILAKSRSLRRFGCQCERVHRIMRRERPNNALGWWCPSALSCSVF